ncbi:tetratricopeptide repeat protein [Bacillus sp. FJAT-44742]|uniref:tetratricopeptide repeat protein n=1 Tax=Bacillus sp. FJAT-44742 TaxID=2014005 RepID=UPI000C23E6FE|nr:tetratricopeptide repeat protein [Bacillus sp. FJAT-44742]
MNSEIEQALRVIEKGNVEEGLTHLHSLEEKADHQTKYDLAALYQELGRSDRARPLVEELLTYYPDEGELYILAAEIAIDLDEEEDAIEWLLEIKEEDSTFLQAQLLLADLYQLQGLDEVAEDKMKKALQHAPEEPVLLAGLGEFYIERGDFNKSIPYLKQANEKGFQFPEGSLALRLAEAYSATGQFEEALSFYEKGLKEKTELSSLFGYGYTALQVGDYELAARKLEEVKSMDKEFASLYPYLARAYEGVNDFKKALEVAEEGIKVDEFNDDLYVEAGKLYLKSGQKEPGEKMLREALAINPGNQEAFLTLLSYLEEQEQGEELLELVSHLREMGEEDPVFTWYEGKAKNLMDELEEALTSYENAFSAFSEDIEFIEEYGRILLEMGHREKALHQFRILLEKNPSRQDIEELIMELEEAMF